MKTLRFILTNECNSHLMLRTSDSSGGCKFCYRQTDKIETSPEIIKNIFERINEYGKIEEIVITGGEPLLSRYFNQVVDFSNSQELYVTLHTNGILLKPKLDYLKRNVSCVSLPLDGSNSNIQGHYRGRDFYDLTMSNIKEIKMSNLDIGINTFVSDRNLQDIANIAEIVSSINPRYWLLSQHRRINGNQARNSRTYYCDVAKFNSIIAQLRERYPALSIFSLESEQKSFPERIWIQSNGKVYTDLTENSNNVFLGNILNTELKEFIKVVHQLKLKERGESDG